MAKTQTNNGWISIHRDIQGHWIWQDENKLKWWLDILLTVNNADGKVNIGLELFDCKRGQSLLSINSWGKRWGVHKDTARNFIKLLVVDSMVECVSIGKSTRLTVCNYDDYQFDLRVKSPRAVREANTNNKIDINIYQESFSVFEKTFDDFLKMRVKVKKPASERAIELLKAKLQVISEGDETLKIQILEQSILNNWQDIYPIKVETFKQQIVKNNTNPAGNYLVGN